MSCYGVGELSEVKVNKFSGSPRSPFKQSVNPNSSYSSRQTKEPERTFSKHRELSILVLPSLKITDTISRSLTATHSKPSSKPSSRRRFSKGTMEKCALQFDEPSLLRAANLSAVISCMGNVLKSNTPDASQFNLASTATGIDVFISHNWSTPRFPKFLSLALHFNLGLACITSSVLFLSVLILVLLRIIRYDVAGTLLLFLGTPLFWTSIIFGRDVASFFYCSGPRVFLDKMCIHQIDRDLQLQGIRALGAYIQASSSMLIVFTPTYLRKLWTVYELGTLLSLETSSDNIIVVTPFLAKLVLWLSWASYFLFGLMGWLEQETNITKGFTKLLCLPGAVLMTYKLLEWAISQNRMMLDICSFSAAEASCACDSDRPRLYANIRSLMIAIRACDPEDTEHVALSKFDAMVRERMPTALQKCTGKNVLRFREVAIIISPFFWTKVYHTLLNEQNRDNSVVRFLWGLHNALEIALLIIAFTIALRLSQANLHLVGWKKLAWSVCIAFVAFIMFVASDFVSKVLVSLGETSVFAFVALACYVALLYSVVWYLYARRLSVRSMDRLSLAMQSSGASCRSVSESANVSSSASGDDPALHSSDCGCDLTSDSHWDIFRTPEEAPIPTQPPVCNIASFWTSQGVHDASCLRPPDSVLPFGSFSL